MNKFEFAHTADGIARQAGALLRKFYEKGVSTEYKGDVDIVTEADRASEQLIREKLKAAFPTHGVYGEEGTRDQLDSEYRWYVDPLDGTTNFAHGFPAFCVVLGLEHRPPGLAADADGEMVAGVIYDPLRNEMFSAERGKGAFLNGRAIHVSKTKTLQESLTATGFPSRKRHASPNVHFYQEITLRSHGVRRAGSAALDLAYVACGRLDGFWEFNLNPWDTSAGVLLVAEAGGTVTHFDGGKFTLDSREVLATNGLILPEMKHIFVELFAGRGLDPIPTPAEFAARRAEAAK
ncbi:MULTISPECIES: inositol monophosphatase family protein [Acidobacteriaceae]|uniref:inositol monophosphatase family protein n=1 Tax=Acidobacteriaceae TaxID=204434 RepID=UPI00131E4EF7|nr:MULTISPECIES: inositol monophosphatase family protein [Acidobacteriaceae]MDW5264436.1 inositol monophosphatase family protein [Edaphobacter sp.]